MARILYWVAGLPLHVGAKLTNRHPTFGRLRNRPLPVTSPFRVEFLPVVGGAD